ncbi:hypothetical protein NUW54_g4082 [Trametes sanguinea]|uniref:Uncharacterized protein n=1 Tax=Trametes sanguinea TaxID=158606 RepID=A0ACC1Q2I5_9APHY|nr:hypothetical protein NUW54_g4082 [Trametes sanguinea]
MGQHGTFLTLSAFLDVVESLTLLKELRLHGFLYSACKEISPMPGRVVSLPALTDFAVGDYEAEVHVLLQSVQLPGRVRAAVYVRPPTEDDLDAPESMTDINFPNVLSQDRSIFPILRTAETVRVNAERDVLQLVAIKGDEHLVLDIATGVEGCGRLVYFALDGLIDLFGQAPLRTLEITGELTFELCCPYRFVAVFEQFPTLENLRMEPTDVVWDFEAVLSALAQPARGDRGADFGPPNLGTPPNDSQVLCPRLKKIDFNGMRWNEPNGVSFTSLVDCLRLRAAKGVYLQELRMALLVYIKDMSPEEAMGAFRYLYHDELRALVPGGVVRACAARACVSQSCTPEPHLSTMAILQHAVECPRRLDYAALFRTSLRARLCYRTHSATLCLLAIRRPVPASRVYQSDRWQAAEVLRYSAVANAATRARRYDAPRRRERGRGGAAETLTWTRTMQRRPTPRLPF